MIAFETAARALMRYRAIATWLDLYGRFDERSGHVKPAADLELRAERQRNEAWDRLGLNPMARVRIGLQAARAHQFDLAQQWAQSADEPIDGQPTRQERRMTTDLVKARADVGAFSALIGQPLAAWHADALGLETPTTVIVAPR